MKLKSIAAAFATTAVLTTTQAFAGAGTVNFSGEILDAACTVDVASQNQTVEMGKYSKSEFAAQGDVTSAKKFQIVLKACPDTVKSAKLRFDGTPDATNTNLLAVDSSVAGAATGVAINLLSADKAVLPLGGENSYSYALSATQDTTLDFYAQYKATAEKVTAGPANAVANFSIVYN